MFKEFKKFILRGSLVDLAIGFTVGSAFSTVAKSLVDDILMPPLGILLGNTDFSNFYIVLKSGSYSPPYSSFSEAQEVGAVTLNIGLFLNNLFALLIVAFAIFFVIKMVNRLEEGLNVFTGKKSKEKNPTTKKCPYCLTIIPFKATKCSACTSQLPKNQQ